MTGPGTINEGSDAVIDMFADIDPEDPGMDYWQVDWGDGSVQDVTPSEGSSETQADHTYTTGDGDYTVNVTAVTGSGDYAAPEPVYVSVIPTAPRNLGTPYNGPKISGEGL